MGPRIFISYSNSDREFVRLLDASLRIAGVETVRDERDLKVGESIPQWVFESIATANGAVFVVSIDALSSRWLDEEISAAKVHQIDSPEFRIIPLMLEGAEAPSALRHTRSVGFGNWRDADEFRVSVAALLSGLGVEPLLISGDEVEWWLAEQPLVSPARDVLAVVYGYLDAAVGYGQWFEGHNPLGWVGKELREGEFVRALDLLASRLPDLAEDPRFAVLREGIDDLRKWRRITIPYTEGDAHDWARMGWIPLGRILGVLTELESSATLTFRVAAGTPKGGVAAASADVPPELDSPFRVGADAPMAMPGELPGPVDVLWREYKSNGEGDGALAALVTALRPEREAAVASYRDRFQGRIGLHPTERDDAEVLKLLDAAILNAIQTHPSELGLSIRSTVARRLRRAVSQYLADRASSAVTLQDDLALGPSDEDTGLPFDPLPIVISAATLAVAVRVFVALRRARQH